VVSVLVAVALSGCGAGGQTGQEFADSGGDEGSAQCRETRETVDAGVGQPSLGFSGADVLAFAAGEFEVPLVWEDLTPEVEYVPGVGETSLRINIESDGSATYVRATPEEDPSGAEIAFDCEDALELWRDRIPEHG
jgi:hypothetical protein